MMIALPVRERERVNGCALILSEVQGFSSNLILDISDKVHMYGYAITTQTPESIQEIAQELLTGA